MIQTLKVSSVIAAAILLSVALPLVVSPTIMALFIVLVIGVLAVFYLLKNPFPGFVLLIVGAIAIPFEVGTGTQSSINPAMIMIAMLTGLWLVDMIVQKKIEFIRSRALIPPLALVISAIFSFLIGQLRWYPIEGASLASQIGGVALFALSAAVLMVAAHQIKSIEWIERLTWIFLACSGYYLLLTHVIPAFTTAFDSFFGRLFSRGTPGSVLWVWIFALTFSQILCNNRLKLFQKALLGLLFATAFYFRVIVTPYWSSGWVPAVAAITVIGLIYLRWVGISLGVAGAFAYVIYGSIFKNLLLADNEYSFDTRIEAWQIAANVFKVNPLFGLGPSNYYNYTSLYPIRGYFVPFNSHNNYVDLLLEVGLVGFLIFLWMLFELWRTGWRLKSIAPPGFAYAFVVGCLGGVVGTAVAAMFGDWVIPFVYNIGFIGFRSSMLSFFFFGCLIALGQILAKKGYNGP